MLNKSTLLEALQRRKDKKVHVHEEKKVMDIVHSLLNRCKAKQVAQNDEEPETKETLIDPVAELEVISEEAKLEPASESESESDVEKP